MESKALENLNSGGPKQGHRNFHWGKNDGLPEA
jgi:hypothetical protein